MMFHRAAQFWPRLAATLVFGIVSFSMQAASAALAHWRFDEAEGTVAHDALGAFLGALSTTGAGFVSGGVSGNALYVDRSSNGYVNIGNVLAFEQGDFSLVTWIKMNAGDTTESSIILGKHIGGYPNGYFLAANNSREWAQPNRGWFYDSAFAFGQELTSTTTVNDGNWHQLVAVYKAGGVKLLYVDGAPAEATGNALTIVGNTGDFLVGGYIQGGAPAGSFTGWMDEVQVYGRTVSPSEVDFLFQNPAAELPNCLAPPDGVVAWWRAESNRLDAITNHHGAAVGDLGYAPGKVGTAFAFNGTNAAIAVAPAPDINLQSLTIEGWIRPDDSQAVGPLVEWNDGSGGFGVHFWINVEYEPGIRPAVFANLVGTDGAYHPVGSDPGILKAGAWHHVALTYDQTSGTEALYLDGVTAQSTNLGPLTLVTSYPLSLGRRASGGALGTGYYAGLMDEFTLYNRALSAAEIQAIHDVGATGKCAPNTPPPLAIVSTPLSQRVADGTSLTFSVTAEGLAPFTYQWAFNGTNINSATNSTFALTNVQPADAGRYTVTVSNPGGSLTSAPATLTVRQPPRISAQPQSQRVIIGSTVRFSVTVSGALPLEYRWFYQNRLINGATAPTLILNNVQAKDAGGYTVRISNADGTITSVPAILTLVSGTMLANLTPGGLRLSVVAEAGAGYTIEVSSDLRTWDPLATELNTPATWEFTDTDFSTSSQRFYRLRKL